MISKGNVYVADCFKYRIRKITPTGVVSTVAGNGTAGYMDGMGTNAEFDYPDGIEVATLGNLFVADYNNNRIREITNAGVVSTFAGNGIAGYMDGTGTNAEFNSPAGICINQQGDFFVSDENGNRIRKIMSMSVVALWAGNGTAGYLDGPANKAEFDNTREPAVDLQGIVYVPDFDNNRVRSIISGSLPITLLEFKDQKK